MRGIVQNLFSQCRTLRHQRRGMLLLGLRLFAKHSLAGARRIHQHFIEYARQCCGNAVGAFIQQNRVGKTHALQIAFQRTGTGRGVFIRHQQSLSLQRRSQLCAFAARRGAQVQHILTGLDIQQRRRCGCARLLYIVHTGVIIRMQSGAEFGIIQLPGFPAKTAGMSCNSGFVPQLPARLVANAHPVERQTAMHTACRAVPLVIFTPQQGAFSGFKIKTRHPRLSFFGITVRHFFLFFPCLHLHNFR